MSEDTLRYRAYSPTPTALWGIEVCHHGHGIWTLIQPTWPTQEAAEQYIKELMVRFEARYGEWMWVTP